MIIKNLEKIIFFISFFISLNLINIFYTSNISPDFNAYYEYIEHFYGLKDNSGRENGLIYFYLITQMSNFLGAFKFFYFTELIISNAVHLVNSALYLTGLFGLKNILSLKRFNNKNIFLAFSLLNFSPITLKLITTMKPEILAFAFLPWALYFFELFIIENKKKFLFSVLFILLTVLNSKATIVASVGMIGIYLIYKNYIIFKNNRFTLTYIALFLFLYTFIIYENFYFNEITIFQHIPTGERKFFTKDKYITYSFLYNINFKELISFPFKDTHADSLIGILLLDSFGDYFKWYENNSESLFSINEKQYAQFWYLTHWRELVTLFSSFIFYFSTIFYFKKFKSRSFYYLIYIFGIIPLLIIAFSNRATFDFSSSELFKSHYYSYLLFISSSFVITSFFESKKINKLIIYFIVLINFLFILGFPKNIDDTFSKYVLEKNKSSIFCEFNNIAFQNTNSDCFNRNISICSTDIIIKDVRYINYKESYEKSKDISRFPIRLINNDSNSIIVEDFKSCKMFVELGYFIDTPYKKIVFHPLINILFFISTILLIIFNKKIIQH